MHGQPSQIFAGNLKEPFEQPDPHVEIIGESIGYENLPNLNKSDTDVFFKNISVAFVTLINILKVYSFLTSGKWSFPRWRPRWLPRSYNSYISITIQSSTVMFEDVGLTKAI